MDSGEQVVLTLQVTLAVGPLAAYFLGLGLVNSQAHACPVPARTDFIILTLALFPMLAIPLIGLMMWGWPMVAGGVIVAAVAAFVATLPGRDKGWVIYNTDLGQCQRFLRRAIRRLGWQADFSDDEVVIPEVNLAFRLYAFSLLRNVSVRACDGGAGGADRLAIRRLGDALRLEMRRESVLVPSPAAASLVLIGAAMLAVPMGYLFQHMPLIVHVVRHMLSA